MPEINTTCPVCEKDIIISSRDILLATQHKADTGGNILVSCPECCRVLVMPIPTDIIVEEWIAEIAEREDWNGCVPLLDPTQAKIPNGSYSDLGVTMYRPGSGDTKTSAKRSIINSFMRIICIIS